MIHRTAKDPVAMVDDVNEREPSRRQPTRPLREEIREGLAGSPGILMTEEQCLLIGATLRLFPACRFLVFGAGHDSRLWHDLNAGGATLFLEHHEQWRQDVLSRDPELDLLPVKYSTSILQWRELLDHPESLHLDLPARVRDSRWDVILVDAPNGFAHVAHHPMTGPMHGRMQSICAARELVADGGFVMVDDTDREVEATYADRYLERRNLVFKWRTLRRRGNVVEMRCYHVPGASRRGAWRARWLGLRAAWMGLARMLRTGPMRDTIRARARAILSSAREIFR